MNQSQSAKEALDLSRQLVSQGKFQEALEATDQALALKPDYAAGYIFRASFFAALK